MDERFELNKLQVIQLFRSLPKSTIKGDMFIVQRAGKFLFSPLQSGKNVKVGSPHRLRVMEGILPFITSLKIYESEDGQASCFVALMGHLQMVFAFSGPTRLAAVHYSGATLPPIGAGALCPAAKEWCI